MTNFVVDVFCEDRAHEEFLRPMVERLGSSQKCPVTVRVRAARGGHSAALEEFDAYQLLLRRGMISIPDVAVIAIDGNCHPPKVIRDIHDHTKAVVQEILVVACPDPAIERWYAADPQSFKRVVGVEINLPAVKCEQGLYKDLLADAVGRAGRHLPFGYVSLAPELVSAMDLRRASMADPALSHFIRNIRGALRRAGR